MNEVLKSGIYEFRAGDRLSVTNTIDTIEILDIVDDVLSKSIHVVLKKGFKKPELMDARLFVYLVDSGWFTFINAPIFKNGDSFVHNYNNTTATILAASPSKDELGRTIYFISLVDDKGFLSYTAVEEDYLANSIRIPQVNDTIPLPILTGNEVLPDVVYLKV